MEKDIIKLLENTNKALDFFEISEKLGYTKDMDELLARTLTEMVNKYQLYQSNKGRYTIFRGNEKKEQLYKGKFLDTNSDYAFVRVEGMEDDIFIHGSKRGPALDGDMVLVRITKNAKEGRKMEGEVLKVIERELKNHVGEVYHFQNKIMVALDSKKINKRIYLPNTPETRMLVDGDKVVVSFEYAKLDKDDVVASFVQRIGHINDPGIDILSKMIEHEIPTEFSEEYLEQLKTIPTEVVEKDLVGRRDYRDRLIYTIDGADTKDIDDAISIEKLSNGHYKLGVHIADVTHYIPEDSPIDLEARNRATSGYFGNTVNPMYHHQISNGIASLNQGVDRLTISYEEEIDEKGKCVTSDVCLAVINSKKKMTYDEVNKILEENIVPSGYEDFADNLRLGYELADILIKEGKVRGSIDFDTLEPKFIYDENNRPIDVQKRHIGKAEKMIEMFMVRANEGIGKILYYAGIPAIYRDHGEPDEKRLTHFLTLIATLGIKLKTNVKNINYKTIQKLVEELKEYPEYRVLAAQILCTMDKAIYSSENLGHFALALKIYLHFTSPIRRYADTCVHRALHKFILDKNININQEKIDEYNNKFRDIAIHCSDMERANDDCEREVDDMDMAEVMQGHIDEEYVGMISGVASYGFFVQLDNLAEGLVKADTIPGGYFFDNELEMARSDKEVFQLGRKVLVKVVRASREAGEIDFEFVGGVDENEKVKKKC